MHAFERQCCTSIAIFEAEEVDLLTSLLSQLIELLGCQTQVVTKSSCDDDPLSRLEAEMGYGATFIPDRSDPVIDRLFPHAYHDEGSDEEFHRYTAIGQCEDKIASARKVLKDLESCRGGGECRICDSHLWAWLKTLTNLRLALGVRLNITGEECDHEDLDESDPRFFALSIYEWLGWVQESLVAVADDSQ